MLYWVYGFGAWLGSGFRVCFLLEIDYREEHKEHEHVLHVLPKKREKKLIENLFFSFLIYKKVRNFIIILLICQFLQFGDGMVLQGLKCPALIGLGTKSGKNKM